MRETASGFSGMGPSLGQDGLRAASSAPTTSGTAAGGIVQGRGAGEREGNRKVMAAAQALSTHIAAAQ